MEIQQGNFVSQDMLSKLKRGMTREQVRFVLGTPLVTDMFHADRWDYVYFVQFPDGKREQRNLSVVFEKDKLVRVLGDLVPPQGAAVQSSGFAPQVTPDAPGKPAAAGAVRAVSGKYISERCAKYISATNPPNRTSAPSNHFSNVMAR